MVTLKEYQECPEDSILIYKETGFGQPKAIMRFKLNQIGEAYCKDLNYPSPSFLPKDLKVDLQNILAETLEHFEIGEVKVKEDVNPTQHKSRDGKGEFCHKCGLQKINTKIVEEGDKVLRVCQECLGI